jgi:hypothetical protein
LTACAAATATLSAEARAGAAGLGCQSPRIHLELAGKPEWEAEIPALRTRLAVLEHVDACAHVTIRGETDGVSVEVRSGTRAAARHLSDPSELVRTVEALIVLPPPFEELDASAPDGAFSANPAPDGPGAPQQVVHSPLSSHMEFAAGASTRVGGNPLLVGAGIAASAGLIEGSWIVGVDARWEFADGLVSATAPSGFSMDSAAIGVAVGHRSELGPISCDALIGPTVVLESQEAYGPRPDSTEGIGGSALDARLDLTLRATVPRSSRFRVYAAGDIEVSPHRLAHPKQLDPELPPLPAWTSGVAVGMAWGVR